MIPRERLYRSDQLHLQKSGSLLKMWRYAIASGANVVLMRHGPKSGSNDSNLSEQGIEITREYGEVISQLNWGWFQRILVGHTEKKRTIDTVELLFPKLNFSRFVTYPKLNSPPVSKELQEAVNKLHLKTGRWRGYSLNETYGLFNRLSGSFTVDMEEDLWDINANKVAEGIGELFGLNQPVIFCGHSPNLELGIVKILDIDLAELGGFLKPLDSVHLKLDSNGKPVWVARINPIRDYIDLEAEHYLELPSA